MAKQKANPVIDQLNIWAQALGKNYPIPHLTTIRERDADAYVRATEARRSLRSGNFTNSPRNDNFIYKGLISSTPAPQKKAIKPSPTYFPTATPTKVPTRLPTAIPTATRVPIRSVTPAPQTPQGMFDFSGYKISKPGFEGKTIPQPPQDIANIIWKMFGARNEATPAAAVAWAENGLYNPNAVNKNFDGTVDYGIFQVNSATFNGLKTRPYWKERMAQLGIGPNTQPEDVLFNPQINAQVAALIREDEDMAQSTPWIRWFGGHPPPRGKGINLQEMINLIKKNKKNKK